MTAFTLGIIVGAAIVTAIDALVDHGLDRWLAQGEPLDERAGRAPAGESPEVVAEVQRRGRA